MVSAWWLLAAYAAGVGTCVLVALGAYLAVLRRFMREWNAHDRAMRRAWAEVEARRGGRRTTGDTL